MRNNKTAKMGILAVIVLLAVAFAATITTNLIINGTAPVQSNQDDFSNNVKFSTADATKPYLMVNGVKSTEVVPEVSADGKTINFTAPALKALNDSVELHYWVVNESQNYDAKLGDLTCEVKLNNEVVAEANSHISVTPANGFNDLTLASGNTTTSDDSVEVKMVKSYEGDTDLEYKIACTITATGVGRNS